MNDKFNRKRKKNKKRRIYRMNYNFRRRIRGWKKVIDRLIKNEDYKEEWEEL